MRDQSGFTVIEMLAGIIGFTAIFGAIMQMTIVATHQQDQIALRVASNERARPTLTRVMDNVRSGCVAPRVTPIQAGSTSTQMVYLSRAGSEVSPVPDRRVLTFLPASGSLPPRLEEQVYPATGGTPPIWTFSGTALTLPQFQSPPNPRRTPPSFLNNVSAPGGVAFRYYDYVNGQLSASPLPVPLSSTNASRAAFVTVNMTVLPSRENIQDPNSRITLTDSADLRLESAGQVSAVDNLPCM
jgi:hypothetical protein